MAEQSKEEQHANKKRLNNQSYPRIVDRALQEVQEENVYTRATRETGGEAYSAGD
jgi:hypothetical protein